MPLEHLGLWPASYYPSLFSPYLPFISAHFLSTKFLYILGFFVIFPIIFLIIGIISSSAYVRITKTSDPGAIVIDEVVGALITFCIAVGGVNLLVWSLPKYFFMSGENSLFFSTVVNKWFYIFMFFAFRFFDIFKPGPIGFIDKNMKSGFGVMFDDVLAGIFAGITTILFFAIHYLFIK